MAQLDFYTNSADILASSHIEDNHGELFVRGWWKSVTSTPFVKTFKLDPNVGKYYQSLEAMETFQFIQGRPHDLVENALNLRRFTHWNEKGVRQGAHFAESDINKVNWDGFKSLSDNIHRHLRNRMFHARLFKRPILKGAYSDLKTGGKLF